MTREKLDDLRRRYRDYPDMINLLDAYETLEKRYEDLAQAQHYDELFKDKP